MLTCKDIKTNRSTFIRLLDKQSHWAYQSLKSSKTLKTRDEIRAKQGSQDRCVEGPYGNRSPNGERNFGRIDAGLENTPKAKILFDREQGIFAFKNIDWQISCLQ